MYLKQIFWKKKKANILLPSNIFRKIFYFNLHLSKYSDDYLKYFKTIIYIGIYFIISPSINNCADTPIYFRFNQVGFLPNDYKSAVLLSNQNLDNKKVEICSALDKHTVFMCELIPKGAYGELKFSYVIEFSEIANPGKYFIKIGNQKSDIFKISYDVYNGIADSLLQFFRVQRCGYTNPYLHKTCHIADATSIIDGEKIIKETFDVTGGWHDAGDYIKFLNTTAYTTYMLLFAYDFNQNKFNFDDNKNNIPDILEEAKIGLDWLLRCNFHDRQFVTQVQDLRDHDVGWRMPANDSLVFDRPAFIGIGKNLIGIYTATLALAYRIWKNKLQYYVFADKCLNTAKLFYSIKNNVPNIDSSGTGMYLDKTFEGKLSLGAIELYLSTRNEEYLNDAKNYADSAGPDYWWSWGDINSIAHYRLAKLDLKYADYIKKNLDEFNLRKDENLFGLGASPGWGTNVTLLGITLQNILLKSLLGETKYDTLASIQKDFILGRNPWGISFIFEVGKNYTKDFHHQVSFYRKKLPGGFAAGPSSKDLLKKYKISYETSDKYHKFQNENEYYRDDRMDYVTNEPTITGNATAIFVYGNL